MNVVDVAVVGAGPAGAAAAITLAALGCRVALIDDRKDRDEWRVGETLSGQALGTLDALGATAWIEGGGSIAGHAIASSWGSGDVVVTPSITNPYGGGWHIDRGAFDRMLVDRAEATGAEVWRRTRASRLDRHPDGFHLEGTSGRSRHRARARFVVDATGASRWVARRCGNRNAERYDRQVAIVAELRAPARVSAALLLEACETGWWYTVPTPGERAVAAFVTDADLLGEGNRAEAPWSRALLASRYTRERIEGLHVASYRVQPCGSSRLRDPAGPGWVAIGDAVMTFDPLSSRGITKALQVGVEMAGAIAEAGASPELVLPGYRERCDRELLEYSDVLRWFYGNERRWPHSPFWRRRHEWVEAPLLGDANA